MQKKQKMSPGSWLDRPSVIRPLSPSFRAPAAWSFSAALVPQEVRTPRERVD